MAIEHTFRTIGGKLKTSGLTPIRAIREQCVACVNSPHAVKDCGGELCSLYPFRMGDAHTVSAEQRAALSKRGKEQARKGA